MLRGRRERGSSSSSGVPTTSLLIPPNPAVSDPGSSPTSRGGILLNPLNKDGSPTTALPPSHRSASLSSNTSRNAGSRGYFAAPRRSASVSSAATSNSSNSAGRPSLNSSNEDALSTTSSPSPRLKFAPLPESGRIKRSNSITLGVAARAQLLQGNGMGGGMQQDRPGVSKPHWQQQVYTPTPSAPMWYNGGPMPENVKTLKDLKPGIKKAWGALSRRRRSSSNASNTSEASSAATNESGSESGSAASGTAGGGGGSEADISSINEEDEDCVEVDTPPSTASGGDSTASLLGNGKTQGQGPANVTLTKEGVLVDQPPGTELSNNNLHQQEEGGQPIRRQNSMASSTLSSSALSLSESDDLNSETTDLDTQEAHTSIQGMSESPAYTSGMGPHGHYVPHTQHYDASGTRSGEATPRRGHSPPSSPGAAAALDRSYSNNRQQQHHHHQPHHWTPHISEGGGSGSGSTPGSGANTPRRRMSLGDMNTNSHQYNNRKGTSVFGFDEAQLKSRLGQMDLNSRRRRPHEDEEEHEHDRDREREGENEEEDEVPLPVDSRQVRGAGLELAI